MDTAVEEIINQIKRQIRESVKDSFIHTASNYGSLEHLVPHIVELARGLVSVTGDIIHIKDEGYFNLIPYLDAAYPLIQRNKKYKLVLCGEEVGIIEYHGPTFTDDAIRYSYSIQPYQPLEYIEVNMVLKGGEEDDHGEVRS